jgi:hypothetical protein
MSTTNLNETGDPRSLTKVIYEIYNGVDLLFDESTELADGWYYGHDPYVLYGPYQTVDDAYTAAAEASDDTAKLDIVDMRNILAGRPFPRRKRVSN